MRKLLSCLLIFMFCLNFTGCGNKGSELNPDNGIADQSLLYGVCYESNVRREMGDQYDVDKDAQMLFNLGVKSIRLWMHITNLLDSPVRVNKAECEIMHSIISALQSKGIAIVGMSHTNFNSGSNPAGKPARDISLGSKYIVWLEDYYRSFKTLAQEFPEITMWEVDNEVNNSDFMKNPQGESLYNQDVMAEIATDIFYYASRGIHQGNNVAQSVMGGLVGLLSGRIKTFMEKLYKNIASGDFGYFYGKEDKSNASKNPDDYFQIACWHPYIEGVFSKEVFKKYNDEIYSVILKNEKKHKKVIFSEIGFSNSAYKEKISEKYLVAMFEAAKEMPYLQSILYYKLYDYAAPEKYWTHTISRYGLFYDPDNSRKYTNNENENIVEAGAPKPAAYAFQKIANGKGEININKI